jgi:hypothetical protein
MDIEEDITIYHLSRKKRRTKKRYWIHPIFMERHSKGLFQNYFKDLRNYKERFFLVILECQCNRLMNF